ncbi:unnamed protein product [Symbiodinium sp. CCMP2592]|nr:unnamed protein product [Symbiodinium sp. CCMP2592]
MKVMLEAWGSHDLPSETWLEIVEQGSRVGVEAWTWLQKATCERLRGNAELFVEGKEAIEIGSWESLRQSLGDMYAGREVQKAYKLSWAAIAPHVPSHSTVDSSTANFPVWFLRCCDWGCSYWQSDIA